MNYYADPEPPTREEEEADAWEHWHGRANKAEDEGLRLKAEVKRLRAAIDEAANLIWTGPTQAEMILRRAVLMDDKGAGK